jgi:hypothetical protein
MDPNHSHGLPRRLTLTVEEAGNRDRDVRHVEATGRDENDARYGTPHGGELSPVRVRRREVMRA